MISESKKYTALLFVFLLSVYAFSESFRVHETKIAKIEYPQQTVTCKAGINDAVYISLPDDTSFIQGLTITIKVPRIVAEWRDSVMWTYYTGLNKDPSPSSIDYIGNRIQSGTFGTLVSQTYTIPVVKDHSIKKDPYSMYLEDPSIYNEKGIFLRFQLAMKGTSEEIYDAEFEITVKPILINKGRLTVNLTSTQDSINPDDFAIFIDNQQCNLKDDLLLDVGEHHLNLQSTAYRNESRTFRITKAEETVLNIQLTDITPLVRLAAPEQTVVYLDDELFEIGSDYVPISQGKHTLKFVIGDWEIVRTLNAQNGRNYTINVKMDAIVSEEE